MTNKFTEYTEHLEQALATGKGVDPITALDPEITVQEAYQVQLTTIKKKVDAGCLIVGKKIGLTSYAMQQLLKVDQPDYGHLLDEMEIENDGVIPSSRVLQPRVEAEIAFVLKKDLTGPHVTVNDVLEATDYVLPSLEIVDSRVRDWKIKLEDTIADNASSGLFVLGGKPVKPEAVNLPAVKMVLYKNKEVINTGVGSAALGDPALCVAWLANKLSEYGITLKAGEVILSGALSAAIDAKPGDHFSAEFDHLGQVSVQFSY